MASAEDFPRVSQVRALLRAGRSSAAVVLIDESVPSATDPQERTWLLLLRLAAILNLEHTAEYATTGDRAAAAARELGDPTALGYFHALTAQVAMTDGSLERCVTHLVRAGRFLSEVDKPDVIVAAAWHNLAVGYSNIGFHDQAADAAGRARETAALIGQDWRLSLPEVQVRFGLYLDHRGDTDGCVRVLRALLADADHAPRRGDGLPENVADMNLPWLGYAITRLAALDAGDSRDPRPYLYAAGGDAELADLRAYGEVCRAIAAGDAEGALDRLQRIDSALYNPQLSKIGPGESTRLRALAHLVAGDHAAAYAAERAAFQLTAGSLDRLQTLFVDGVVARLDHEDLRMTVARYADEALTDPLTGLPNRRHLQQYVEAMAERGEDGVLGVLDLDGFKAVNTVHGHLSGDTVLQRAAGALVRIMRRRDFVARYGGDEFVLILPSATMAKTAEIGERITSALAAEDWASLVPGTPLSASIGWAELTGMDRRGAKPELASAFEIADRAMYEAKRASQGRAGGGLAAA